MKNYKKINGITLISLVITIVIMLILVGVSINLIIGNNGLFGKTKQGVEEYKKSSAKEKVLLAISASYDENTNSNKDMLKENINNISGLEQKVSEINYPLDIIVDGYMFTINENGEIEDKGKNETVDTSLKLSCKIDSNKAQNTMKLAKINDMSGNNNFATGYNIELNEANDAISFNGSNSYLTVNKKTNTLIPLTIETTIKPTKVSGYVLLYINPESKTTIGFDGNGHFIVTVDTGTTLYEMPSDFYDGNIKTITVTYNTSITDNVVYVNGAKMTRTTTTDYWGTKGGTATYIGRRENGCYFKGDIYTFRVYDKVLSQEEITNSYEEDVKLINNETQTLTRTNLKLEYAIKKEGGTEYVPYPDKIVDEENNINFNFYNASYTEDRKAIVFDGKSTYAKIDYKEKLNFPMTVEIYFKPMYLSDNRIIYLDPENKVGIGIRDDKDFILSCVTNTAMVKIPSDFYNGEIKHIIVTYGNDETENEMYIDGVKLEKETSTLSWTYGVGTTSYIGRRDSGDYIKGELYGLSVFNRKMDDTEIAQRCNN